MKKKTKST